MIRIEIHQLSGEESGVRLMASAVRSAEQKQSGMDSFPGIKKSPLKSFPFHRLAENPPLLIPKEPFHADAGDRFPGDLGREGEDEGIEFPGFKSGSLALDWFHIPEEAHRIDPGVGAGQGRLLPNIDRAIPAGAEIRPGSELLPFLVRSGQPQFDPGLGSKPPDIDPRHRVNRSLEGFNIECDGVHPRTFNVIEYRGLEYLSLISYDA
jgi:hypothetical protein